MNERPEIQPWPGGIAAVTLFAEDLEATRRFYTEVFGLPVHYEDETSAVFLFGETMVNLLSTGSVPELIEPATAAAPEAGARAVLTLRVADVDATCGQLTSRGAALVNGPMDRPWGIRTASFRDPAGHLWEIAS